jgi:signal transduction histidine kinase
VNAAIQKTLLADPAMQIDYFVEYLESDRFPTADARALGNYIRQKYRSRPIDLVMAIADPALQFVLDYRDQLFPEAPVVYSGVAVPSTVDPGAGAGLTAVTRSMAYVETLKLALDLHPSTKRVFVVAQSPDSQVVDAVHAALRDFSRRTELTYFDAETLPRLLDAVRAVPPRSLILYIWYLPNPAGYDEAVPLVAQASPVPVYGTAEMYLGSGIVGGAVRGTRETGSRMGEMALQILKGRRAEDIPIEDARLVPTFDWQQMKRWGIDPAKLPAGSDTRFKVPTAWESYRWYIVGTIVFIGAQLLLIAGLLTQRTSRRRAEEVIRTREAALRTSFGRIRHLAGRLINAQEAARKDIARDLHDDMCQQLAALSIAVGWLKRSPGHIQDSQTQQALSMLEKETGDVLEGIRRLSHDLHPASLHVLGLIPTLRAHCHEVEKQHHVQVTFETAGDLRHLPPDVAVCLFRIAQESLRNGVVHGDALQFAVSLTRSGEYVELTIADHGRGFDPEAVRDGGGLGLVSMEERAHAVGGDLHIVTSQQGTTIVVRWPARTDEEHLTTLKSSA